MSEKSPWYVTALQGLVAKLKSQVNPREPLKVSHYLTKFGGHRDYNRGDIIVLVCHVILQDLKIKVTGDYIKRSPSR